MALVTPTRPYQAMLDAQASRAATLQQRAQTRQQQIEDARRNAAMEAAVEERGAIAGDLDAYRTFGTMDMNRDRIGMERERLDFTMSEAEKAERAQAATRLANLVGGQIARGVPPEQAFASAAPILERGFGVPPETIAEMQAMVAENPEAGVAALMQLGGVAPEQESAFTPRGAPGEFVINGQRVYGQPGIDAEGNFTVMPADGVRQARDPRAADRPRPRSGPITVIGQDGKPITVVPMNDGSFVEAPFSLPEDEGQGSTPTERREARERTEGKRILGNNLRRAATIYTELLEEGGAVDSTSGNPLRNLGAAIARGTPGLDTLLAAAGNRAGSLANEIEGLQATLLQGVMQATGMSARQLDSNRELQFYLNTATKPGRDIIANYSALYALDRNYGTGANVLQFIPEEMREEVMRRAGELEDEAPAPYSGGSLPDDLPDPSNEPDGTVARDPMGNIVGVVRNGQWEAP